MSEPARTPSLLAEAVDAQLEVLDTSRLKPVGERPALGAYVGQLWRRRHFIVADSRARAFSGNRDTLLGRFWLVGKPVLDGLTFFLIFGLLLGTSRGIDNYIGFLLIGVFMFSFTSGSLTAGASVMVDGQEPHPRLLLPPGVDPAGPGVAPDDLDAPRGRHHARDDRW